MDKEGKIKKIREKLDYIDGNIKGITKNTNITETGLRKYLSEVRKELHANARMEKIDALYKLWVADAWIGPELGIHDAVTVILIDDSNREGYMLRLLQALSFLDRWEPTEEITPVPMELLGAYDEKKTYSRECKEYILNNPETRVVERWVKQEKAHKAEKRKIKKIEQELKPDSPMIQKLAKVKTEDRKKKKKILIKKMKQLKKEGDESARQWLIMGGYINGD